MTMPITQNINDGRERRKFPRYLKKLNLRFRHDGAYKEGLVQNVSIGGMFFRTKARLDVNSPLQFMVEFPFEEGVKKCVLHGRVLRIEEDPHGLWPEIGCSFAYSSPSSLKMLNDFLHDDIPERSSKGPERRAFTERDPRLPTWWIPFDTSMKKKSFKEKRKRILDLIKRLFKN